MPVYKIQLFLSMEQLSFKRSKNGFHSGYILDVHIAKFWALQFPGFHLCWWEAACHYLIQLKLE